MPIYEYRCTACQHKLESLQKFSDAPLVVCPQCGRDALTKLVSAAGFHLKGSGWYQTDFKNSGSKPAAKPAASKKPDPKKAAPDTTPVDLTVELVDASGGTARVPLSQFGKPRKPLEITVYRRKGRDKTVFPNTYEIVLQTYVMPVREFTRGSTGFDATRVRTIRLVFDRTQVGQVVVDDIGFSAIDPAYLAQRN